MKFKCPVCEKYDFEYLGDHDICDVCGWENDDIQYDDPDFDGGANKQSLNEYKNLWKEGKIKWQRNT